MIRSACTAALAVCLVSTPAKHKLSSLNKTAPVHALQAIIGGMVTSFVVGAIVLLAVLAVPLLDFRWGARMLGELAAACSSSVSQPGSLACLLGQ